jgi:acetyl-CoA C-acetyltransferase
LGALVIREAVKQAGLPENAVEKVVMGNGWQAGVGPNPARIAAWNSGVAAHVPAFTVNMRCASGLAAVSLVADAVRLGDIRVGVAGGMESTSNVPYLLPQARWGHTMGEKPCLDSLHRDGFACPLAGMLMGETAELLAEKYGITREEQEVFALESHRKAVAAIDTGHFDDEILPVTVKRKKETVEVATDEIPRRNTGPEKLSKLPPVFRTDGTVTAATSSALCDGAAALVIADEGWAEAHGYRPLAEITGYASAAVEPKYMGLGPVDSTPPALERAGVGLEDIDLIELNEAFAVQVIAVQRELGFSMDRLNVCGGAIALGHPIGATGAKILTTLVHALRREKKELGLATACVGGGQGVSIVVKSL